MIKIPWQSSIIMPHCNGGYIFRRSPSAALALQQRELAFAAAGEPFPRRSSHFDVRVTFSGNC
jgi:hypothetical protein